MEKLWAGRAHAALDKAADDFNSSIAVDSRMYNAKDFITLCERIGRRQPVRHDGESLTDRLPDAARETPERTSINQYNQYF